MKPPLRTMAISIFGVPLILLLHQMAEAADEMDSFQRAWQDMKAHPPLNRTAGEKDYLMSVAPPKGGGGMKDGKPCIRKECRTLTETERNNLFKALNLLKKTLVQNGASTETISQYDVFVGYHRFDIAMGAHYGPAFLPWHREYLARFERALQKMVIGVCLCYIDWTLDQGIPVPGDSALWTSKYLGNNYGLVKSGPAANWKAYPKDCANSWPTVYRAVVQGSSGKNSLHTDAKIAAVYAKTDYPNICVPYNNAFESYHNSVHTYVGGHMTMLSCAPNDPIFYFHHTYVDCLWQEFRLNHQQTNLETDYPRDPNMVSDYHKADDIMSPFTNLRNIDGLSKGYSKQYACQKRPIACVQQKDCNSDVLWCNKGRCLAKIREGGKCEKLPDESCYSENCKSPKCVNGICKC